MESKRIFNQNIKKLYTLLPADVRFPYTQFHRKKNA
jgi:hypothetical protein